MKPARAEFLVYTEGVRHRRVFARPSKFVCEQGCRVRLLWKKEHIVARTLLGGRAPSSLAYRSSLR
jgi:hypothetical protein